MSLCLIAGELSADLYGARIMHHLKGIPLWGVGGQNLKAQGQEQILTFDSFKVMGYSDVLKKLPTLTKNFLTLRNEILARQPKVLCIIDQPSFGMRLATSLRKRGYTGSIVQFVAPTVWAYNPKRAEKMATSFDLLLTLFPFEPAYFAHTNLKTIFVGHPILEIMAEERAETLSFGPKVLSLFPGSRPDEIRRNFPKQLEAARLIQQSIPDIEIAVCATDSRKYPSDISVVPFDARYELMQKSSLAIAKCGTVTLELALKGVPTVVTYELSVLNRLIGQHFLHLDRMPYYSIANILCKKELFPELIKPPVTASMIAQKALELISSQRNFKNECAIVKQAIESIEPASLAVAKELRDLLN